MKMNKHTERPYIILGAGGHGAVIADILYQCGCSLKGFLDDGAAVGTEIFDLKVIGAIDDCNKYAECLFLIGIGDNIIRKIIAEKYPLEYGTAIHPSSVIGKQVEIGCGTVIMAGVAVNSRTNIGKHCIVNTKTSIDHDNNIGNFAHVSPGATLGGTVSVGDCTHIGIGATVKNNITICNDVVVGAGAVVVKDITGPGVYIGVPAGRIK